MEVADKISIEILKVVNRAITKSSDLEDMASHLTQFLVGTMGIKGCAIFVLNPDSEELEILGSFGLSANYLNKGPLLVKKSIYQKLKGKPIVIRDVRETDRLQYPEDAQKEGIRAIASIPVRLRDKFIGVLRLYHYQEWDISSRDLDFLGLLAENIGLAMMYTRLHHALRSVRAVLGEIHPVWLEQQ